LRKCAKSWESVLKVEKVWERVPKLEKVWESVPKPEKVWECVPKPEKVWEWVVNANGNANCYICWGCHKVEGQKRPKIGFDSPYT